MTVSVCMITYNHESFVKEAIQGVLSQKTNFAIELIISDDASTDKTNLIISNLVNNTKNITIKYFNHIQNKGMMSNFIFALEECKGKYIAICEGDDYWTDPLKLQKQVDFLEGNPEYSMCFHEAEVVNEKGGFISYFNNLNSKKSFNIIDFTKSNFVSTASCVYRNMLIFPDNFYNLPAADWALHILNAEKGDVYYLPDCMSAYRKHNGGIWSSLDYNEMILKGVEVMEKLNIFFNYKYQVQFREGIDSRLARLIKPKVKKSLAKRIINKIKRKLNK